MGIDQDEVQRRRSSQGGDGFEPRRAAKEEDASREPSGNGKKENKKKPGKKKRRPLPVRILLFLLRTSIVPLILIIALIAGLYIGYVMLGKGPEGDVWEWQTWRHMYDLIFSDS
ncbi:DNA-directed RNA polymerase subunit beta [Paenibacillus sp. GCM10012307]|uniref:DNA-directed RNA polymerase subunit beta n=1 Tax=Paenibacillus roseus TaxID=2798579 RepID=A0A934J7V3_9BACL|nr:DNA-directed RNA polymerase subunit beta [Paenibacillus roseus]MBJ6361903.1 DNA-directed RNA polymerase subunit beta [Paenibacillus roseus]